MRKKPFVTIADGNSFENLPVFNEIPVGSMFAFIPRDRTKGPAWDIEDVMMKTETQQGTIGFVELGYGKASRLYKEYENNQCILVRINV